MHAIRDVGTTRQLLLPFPGVEDEAGLFDLIARAGALLDGHFLLQSGRHSQYFLRFKPIGWDRKVADDIARRLIDLARGWIPEQPGTIISPESAGVFLGAAIARALKWEIAVTAIDAARRPTRLLRTGAVQPGRRVLVVNDVVTTGSSLAVIEEFALGRQALVIGELAFACRNTDDWRASLAARSQKGAALLVTRWPLYKPPECPLCASKQELIPATEFN